MILLRQYSLQSHCAFRHGQDTGSGIDWELIVHLPTTMLQMNLLDYEVATRIPQ